MTLGTNLVQDVYRATLPSSSPTAFVTNLQTAVDNYLATAVYGGGALTYESAGVPPFVLPVVGTPAGAATLIATSVMNYWLPAGAAVGVAGEPTQETSVVAGTITATSVATDLTATLTTIFSDLSSGQYWTNEEVANHLLITGEDLKVYDNNPSLLAYNTTTVKWFNRVASNWEEVTDTKFHEIAAAITAAIGGVVVAWTEITPPNSAIPFIGGVT